MAKYGGIEAGGTKFICGVGTGPHDLETYEFSTAKPEETVCHAIEWLKAQGKLNAVGIASFGPVDLNTGHITSTPKPGWSDFDFAGTVQQALNIPVAFQTDVNAALLAEMKWGAAQGIANAIYMTVGTGIGGAAAVGGKLLQGATHPEMGHMRIPHDGSAKGVCPFHGDCLEGLASGPAKATFEQQVEHLAQALANLTCILTPERIILGGGVMQNQELFQPIERRLSALIANYLSVPKVLPPKLARHSGILGAILCGRDFSRVSP